MTATALHPAWAPSKSRLLAAMYAGLLLTVLAGVAPLIDVATVDSLYDHVRQAYPDWPADTVRQDRDAIAIYLAAVGALGLLSWLGAIWAVAAERRWARGAVTSLFALGTLIALTSMTLGGDQYDTIVPPLYGALGLLPCLAGLAATVLVWKRRR